MDTFKSKMTQFMLSVPDTPPIRGYTPINSNSILEWRNNRESRCICSLGRSKNLMVSQISKKQLKGIKAKGKVGSSVKLG